MKPICRLYLLLVVAIMLSSCVSTSPLLTPTQTETQPPSPTFTLPISTSQLTQAATRIQPATLEPEQAEEAISNLLMEPMGCEAPCFWGIIPGQTTLGEAKIIFNLMGLQMQHTNTRDNKDFYEVTYDFDSGLSVSPVLAIQDDIVKNIDVGINPKKRQAGVPRDWLAYSPETLINQYGTPSRVDFFVGRGAPTISYAMTMYFDSVDLIVEYGGYDIIFETTSFHVCPLTDQFDSVRIWMGQDPQYPPLDEVPLEDATSMTLGEFAKLMTGNPDNACLNLKEEFFS